MRMLGSIYIYFLVINNFFYSNFEKILVKESIWKVRVNYYFFVEFWLFLFGIYMFSFSLKFYI